MYSNFTYNKKERNFLVENVFESKPEEPSKYLYSDETFFIHDKISFEVKTFENPNADIKIRYDECFETVLCGYEIDVVYVIGNKIKFEISNIFIPINITMMCINLDLEAPNELDKREWLQEVCDKFTDKIENEGFYKWGKFKSF